MLIIEQDRLKHLQDMVVNMPSYESMGSKKGDEHQHNMKPWHMLPAVPFIQTEGLWHVVSPLLQQKNIYFPLECLYILFIVCIKHQKLPGTNKALGKESL